MEDASAISLSGMRRAWAAFTQSASRIANASGTNADLSHEMENMTAAKLDYEANLATQRTSNQMTGTLLDLLA